MGRNRVEDCSIAGTSCGDDGGVFRIDGAASIEVDRCLIVDCLAVDQGGVGSLSSDDSFFSLTRCIIDNVDADDESDPLFLAPDDFRIASAESLAVDGGTDLGLTEDIDGIARPQGHAADIGAYESSFTRDGGQ